MLRSVWNGACVLGDLVVPVGLAPTREQGDHKVKVLHSCGQPIARPRAAPECPAHGVVSEDELVRGFEIAPDEYLPVEQEILDAIAPLESRRVDLFAIVDAAAAEQLLVEHAWYLVPARSRAGREAYAALEHGLREESLVALARWQGWGRERLAQVRAVDRVLVLQELQPSSDLRDPGEIRDAIAAVELTAKVEELARKLVSRLELPFESELLTSLHRGRVDSVIDAKLRGENLVSVVPARPEQPPLTGNLEETLAAALRSAPKSRKARREAALAGGG